MPAHAQRLATRSLAVSLGLAAVAALTFAQGGAAPAANGADGGEVHRPGKAASYEVLPRVSKQVEIANGGLGREATLAAIEGDVMRAHRLLATGKPDEANTAFNSAYVALVSLRQHIEPGAPEPLVRDRNLAFSRHAESAAAETWRPISAYISLWMGQFPREFQRTLGMQDEAYASILLAKASAVSGNGDAILREAASRYIYAPSGLVALDRLVNLAFERGDMLDCAAWLLWLKESRSDAFRERPTRQIQLMLALEALGEHSMLADEREAADGNYSRAVIRVGTERLAFGDAYSRLRTELAGAFVTPGSKSPAAATSGLKLSGAPAELPVKFAPERPARVDERYGYMGYDDNSSQLSMVPEALLLDNALVLPAGGEQFMWYPRALDGQSFRWLQRSASDRYRPPEQSDFGGGRWSWRGYSASRVTRVTGATAGQTRGSRGPGRQVLAAIFGQGQVRNPSQYSGNQVQIFDLAREGALLAVLPRKEDLAGLPEMDPGIWGRPADAPMIDPGGAPGMRVKGMPLPLPGGMGGGGDAKGVSSPEYRRALDLSAMHFGGRPLIHNGRMFLLGSVAKASSTEVHAVCFSLFEGENFGKAEWTQKLCSIKDVDSNQSSIIIEGSSLTASGVRVFAVTNCGTAACLDARDGQLAWLAAYRRSGESLSNANRRWGWGYTTVSMMSGIAPSTPVLGGLTLACSPADALSGVSLNAHTGTVIRPMLASRREYQTADFFIGMAGGYAYYQLDDRLAAEPVDFSGMVTNAAGETVYGKPLASTGLPAHLAAHMSSSARGVLTRDEVIVPCVYGLLRFDRHTLAFKAYERWPDLPAIIDDPKPQPKPEEKVKEERPGPEKRKQISEAWGRHGPDGMTTLSVIPASEATGGLVLLVRLDHGRARVYPLGKPE